MLRMSSLALKPAPSEHDAPSPRYQPYPIDWRFLPESLLCAKDWARHRMIVGEMALARGRARAVWRHTLGERTWSAVRNAGVLFIHIPKTGGTSVCAHLYGRNLPHWTWAFYREAFGPEVNALPSFAVLRDPVERLISAYRFLRQGGSECIASDRYERRRWRADRPLADFVHFLADNQDAVARTPGLMPQITYVADSDGALAPARIFAMDRTHGLPKALTQWLGVDALPHLNVSAPLAEPIPAALSMRIRDLYTEDAALFERARTKVLAKGDPVRLL